MPRSLFVAAAGLALAVAFVGFAVGYLNALDEPPATGSISGPVANLPGAADYLGTVTEIGDSIAVRDASGREQRYSADSVTVLGAAVVSLAELRPGDLVVVAVERDQFGSPAIRYLIRVPGEVQSDAAP